MPRAHLTDIMIRAFKPRDRQTYWDLTLPAFGVRVGARSKTFLVMHGHGRRRITLGHYHPEHFPLAAARRKALSIIYGTTPTASLSYDDALELFLKHHCAKNNKPSTARETERLLRRHFRFGSRQLSTITARDINTIVDDLPPAEANHAFVAIRSLLNWCVGRQYLTHTPLNRVKLPNKQRSRDRVLADHEIVAVLTETRTRRHRYYPLIELLLYLGQRCNEIGSLKWEYRSGSTISDGRVSGSSV